MGSREEGAPGLAEGLHQQRGVCVSVAALTAGVPGAGEGFFQKKNRVFLLLGVL